MRGDISHQATQRRLVGFEPVIRAMKSNLLSRNRFDDVLNRCRLTGPKRRREQEVSMRVSKALALCCALLLVSCAPTKQARSVEPSGFLGDLYPLMHKGAEGEALLWYKSPIVATIPRGSYTKILLDHAQLWGPPTTDATRQSQAQHVADILYGLSYLSLSKDYEMVSEPGPGTLRIQAAITRADPAYVVLRAVSTIPAPMNALAVASLLKNLGTGKPLFVGDASIEVKFSDAQSGDILGAGADHRVGNKRLDADSFNSWDDVYKTLKIWTDMLRYRLCTERGGTTCVKPNV
jgi:uncharacterized protein DUF3313